MVHQTIVTNVENNERSLFIHHFSVVGIVTLLLSALPDIYYQVWETLLYVILGVFVFILVIILNRKYGHEWVGLFTIIIFSIELLFLSKSAGYYARVPLFYIPLTIVVPLFIRLVVK